ncbi:receiver/sensor box histidine kinase [Natronomonas moolapensis 8.8.11]|uniref:histidine kinase n=1 Tax=Natronomonas moolapensis (strain DSM 18674 / CECT 7526 / JCM 14361 / 8.8.11) TaxID=268739 RepID=M1XLN7_NATM8|nr:response regulator [Natronomonas moolapensis]CCQ38044.1 receiver/sensor box histidine kinase [Natronomonas moolapensis 8.8.11]
MSSDLRSTPFDQRGVSVLHVDDDPSVLDLTSAFLDRELEAVSVATETSPEDALARLESEGFDCLISDYDMPGMNGLELFEAVHEDHPLLPFVLYTGKGSEEIASQAVNAGVTGYFQKGGPDQQRRLANRVEQAAADYHTRIEADRYSTVLRALEYPIYVVDETGVFSYVNDALVEMTGYEREEIIGSPTGIIKDEAAVEEAENQLGSILSHEGPDTAQFPVDIQPKEGDPIPCRDHMAVLPYEGEEFRGSVGILRNTCSEVRREAELERREAELERQNDRLERFASIVSHDLQSPISVATGRIELAKSGIGEGDGEHLDAAMEALDRMETIVEDTLTLARQGDTVGDVEAVSLSTIVEECWRTTDTGGATVEIVEDLRFRADPDRLRNLLGNLFTNAVNHGGDNATVRVGTTEDGFYVADDGPGIPPEDRSDVFNPGYTTSADGTGFGLAIVDEIAAAHGWRVSVAESTSGGARFDIEGVVEAP